MMQLGDNRMRQFYPIGSLLVLWRIDSSLNTDMAYINAYFAEEMASPFGEGKKSGIGKERELGTLANYTRVKNVVINIGG